MQAIHGGRQLDVDAYDRAGQKKLATGKVESFNSQIDTTTGTLRLRATFENDDAVLFPNQFVNVQLLVDTHRGVTLLPNNAIQRNDNGAFVYLVQPNQTAALKPITPERPMAIPPKCRVCSRVQLSQRIVSTG